MLLDVGSGSHPHPNVDVACDLFFSAHLEGGKIQFTENFVICDAHYLPFRTKVFDNVNCSHVLEHLKDPVLGFKELHRIAYKGQVETPGILYEEILFGFSFHKWTFFKKDGKIHYRKSHRLRLNGRQILPLGWILHNITLHKKFSNLVMPVRRFPMFNMKYSW